MCYSFTNFVSFTFLGLVCLFVTLEIIAYSETITECDDTFKIGPYRLTCCPKSDGGLKCTYETSKSTTRMNSFMNWIYRKFG
jgi:hypothetical protein